jgi:diphthamide synthase subunit DPH2
MPHAGAQMIPKILSSRLAAIQSSMDQGNFAYILDTKLRATNNVVLL